MKVKDFNRHKSKGGIAAATPRHRDNYIIDGWATLLLQNIKIETITKIQHQPNWGPHKYVKFRPR